MSSISSGVPEGVDHLIYAVPDLETGIDGIQRLLGVRPAIGGRHPDYGTRNALVGLGPKTYLEIMAPDPGQARPERGRLFGLDTLDEAFLATWVLRRESIESLVSRASAAGVHFGPVRSGRRENAEGATLSWKLTDPYVTLMDGVVPFLIAWGDTPHPASSAPRGGELIGLRIEHPEPAAVRTALDAIGVEVPVREAPRRQLVATIRTVNGVVELS
jgi:hypothetical protein